MIQSLKTPCHQPRQCRGRTALRPTHIHTRECETRRKRKRPQPSARQCRAVRRTTSGTGDRCSKLEHTKCVRATQHYTTPHDTTRHDTMTRRDTTQHAARHNTRQQHSQTLHFRMYLIEASTTAVKWAIVGSGKTCTIHKPDSNAPSSVAHTNSQPASGPVGPVR